jgi:hypothetical protein
MEAPVGCGRLRTSEMLLQYVIEGQGEYMAVFVADKL